MARIPLPVSPVLATPSPDPRIGVLPRHSRLLHLSVCCFLRKSSSLHVVVVVVVVVIVEVVVAGVVLSTHRVASASLHSPALTAPLPPSPLPTQSLAHPSHYSALATTPLSPPTPSRALPSFRPPPSTTSEDPPIPPRHSCCRQQEPMVLSTTRMSCLRPQGLFGVRSFRGSAAGRLLRCRQRIG